MAAIPAPADAQLNPAPAGTPDASRPPRVEFIALTGDDALLEQIGQTLDGESTIRHAESLEAAHVIIRPLRPCVLLLDARGHQDLAAVVESLQSPDGTCVVVVFTPIDGSADVSRSVGGSATFAVLPIPVEPGQTTAVLDGAREEALARLTLAAQPIVEPATFATATPAPTTTRALAPNPVAAQIRAAGASPGAADLQASGVQGATRATLAASGSAGAGKSRAVILRVAGAVLVGITVAWVTIRGAGSGGQARQPVTASSTVTKPDAAPPVMAPEAVQEGSTEELLDKARAALRERHYTDPEGDNAFVYFRSVLAQEPDNDEAMEGLQRIGVVLDERLQSELAQRKFDAVAVTLADLKLIRPGDAGLAQFDARLADGQIAAAIEAGDVERAAQLLRQASQAGTMPEQGAARWREEIGRRQGDATDKRAKQLARLVASRVSEGRLVEPANDNAKQYLAQLRAMPSGPQGLVDAATAELQQAILLKIREASEQSRRADLDRWLDEASAVGVSPSRIAAAMRDPVPGPLPAPAPEPAGPESARLAQLMQDRSADGRLLEPPKDGAMTHPNTLRAADPSGSAPGKTAPRPLPASEFKRTRYVSPEYPRDALRKGIRGEVRVSITVAVDGKVKSAIVVNSNPSGVFDQAALDAVRRWRFRPVEIDNTAIEATVMTNIVFQPEDATHP